MRLIDLHTDWMLQYATESTDFDRLLYANVTERLDQAVGYLQSTSAAIVSCFRNVQDWSSRTDPWAALGTLITRIEAEFAGRILRDPDDSARWEDDPQGLTWAVIGVEGFDFLVRSEPDLSRLHDLWRRGVRLFQPSYSEAGVLAGSSVPGDDRGLTDLGRRFLEVMASFAPAGSGPRPMVDLAHLNPTSTSDVLDWFEADSERTRRVVPVYSHGCPIHDGFVNPRAITLDSLRRLRAMGGSVGLGVTPPFFADSEQIRVAIETMAAIPFLGRAGYEGIAIGTDFLGVRSTLPGLGNAEAVLDWIGKTYPPEAAAAILFENARTLIRNVIGVPQSQETIPTDRSDGFAK